MNQSPNDEAPLSRVGAWNDRFLSESDTVEKWGAPESVYLLVERDRLAYWQDLLTKRFHIYHQVATCGTYVVLGNQL